jgi:sucrose-6F-phosphate phosphohydrolase
MTRPRQYDMIIIGADYDNSLAPGQEHLPAIRDRGLHALGQLCLELHTIESEWHFGAVTGRSLESLDKDCEELEASHGIMFPFSYKITSVGTRLHYRNTNSDFVLDSTWPSAMTDWDATDIQEQMYNNRELTLQPIEAQNQFKLSYTVEGVADRYHDAYVNNLRKQLDERNLDAEILFSGGQYLDFLPRGVNKGSALLHFATSLQIDQRSDPFIVAFDDSMNGKDALAVADLAVVPSNAQDSLKSWVDENIPPEKLYKAKQPFAAGLLEALYFARILG